MTGSQSGASANTDTNVNANISPNTSNHGGGGGDDSHESVPSQTPLTVRFQPRSGLTGWDVSLTAPPELPEECRKLMKGTLQSYIDAYWRENADAFKDDYREETSKYLEASASSLPNASGTATAAAWLLSNEFAQYIAPKKEAMQQTLREAFKAPDWDQDTLKKCSEVTLDFDSA